MNGDTVYLAGKITGDADYKAKFARARRILENYGYIVLDPSVLPSGGIAYEDCMKIGAAMLDACGGIVLLPDWQESEGAKAEYWRALNTGKEIHLFVDFERAFDDPIGEGEREIE